MTVTTTTQKGPYGENTEIKLQYPRSQRLLLGSLSNTSQPGFLKAMQIEYPVELSVECDRIKGARLRGLLGRRARFPTDLRPFAVFFFKADSGSPSISSSSMASSGIWQLVGRTETVALDESVRFVAKVKLACPTPEDRAKNIRVELFNQLTPSGLLTEQQFLGAVESSIEAITSEPLFRKEIPLQTSRDLDTCTMTLSADIIRPSIVPTRATFNVDFSRITKGDARCFYVMSRELPSGDFTPVYRSEILEHDKKRFASMTRLVDALTAGVDEKLLKLEFYQVVNRKSRCIKLGFLQTSLKKMKEMDNNKSLLWWPSGNTTNYPEFVEIGRVVLLECRQDEEGNCRFLLRVTA